MSYGINNTPYHFCLINHHTQLYATAQISLTMPKAPLLKLPVTPYELNAIESASLCNELKKINDQFGSLKVTLQQLELEKGITSRMIGEAKKKGEPIEPLKAQTKEMALSIKEIKNQINALRHKADTLIKAAATDTRPSLPGHFQKQGDQPVEQMPSSPTALTIRPISDSDAKIWNEYVDKHPHSHVYHRYEFREIIRSSFGHHTLYLGAFDTENRLCGLLPATQLKSKLFGNYLVSNPFFNYGGALADNSDAHQTLMNVMSEQAKRLSASHVEFRDTHPIEPYPQKSTKCALLLSLPQHSDQLWSDIGTKVRAQIKQADSHGLSYKVGGQALLNDFYAVFAQNMRDLGTPVYSKSFFEAILRQYQLDTRIVMVYKKRTPISCAFLISYKGTMEIPWASTLRSANELNANMYLYWHVLKYATQSGHQFFDFGRSTKDAGTYKFKRQWGAQPHQLYWHYWLDGKGALPELNPNNPKYKLVIAAWQRLPIWVTKLVGPHLVKNLP